MIAKAIRRSRVYLAIAAMIPKFFLAYSAWVWMEMFVQTISLVVLISFWKAVYGGGDVSNIAGLSMDQTITYIIMAQIFYPAANSTATIWYFGTLMREGLIGIELLRPLDFQGATYMRTIAEMLMDLILKIPLVIVAWFLYPFKLPTDPLIWLGFVVTLFLGHAALFFFDWIISCVSFFSTEVWGLGVFRFGISLFFTGALVPLTMMPDWLNKLVAFIPFSHALYTPVSLLTGITPLSEAPRIWGIELIYIVVLFFASRFIFNRAVRKVTVQGG